MPLALMGCGLFSDILTWTSVAGVALDGIVTALGSFLPPGGIVLITAIKAFLTDLAGAVTEYENNTDPAAKASLLDKIRTLLSDIGTNFQSFLTQLNLGSNPLLSLILGLAQVILGAIAGFIGQLPATSTQVKSFSVTISGRTLVVVPVYYKRISDFKAAYNSVCAANGHPQIEI
jgi:hypothetical protein